MPHVCDCGTCRQAVERAAGIIKKQITDSECPTFIMAVAQAMSIIAQIHVNVVHGSDAMWVKSFVFNRVVPKLLDELTYGDHMESIAEALSKERQRSQQERDLPKGH